MKRSLFIISVALLGFSACKTPSILISNDLASNSTVMDAKGRQGWQFNQVITYGNYSTSKVKRGWTTSTDIVFFARFQKAEQKLSFTQNTPDNESAEVFAVGKFKNNEFQLLKGFLAYAESYVNSFAGTIIPAKNPSNSWDFIVHNPEASLPNEANCGVAKDTKGNEIQIMGVKKIEGQSNWMQYENYGFEFIQNGKSIGAVSTINNGRVWIRSDISSELKLVVSSIASSMLVRHSMQDSFEN